MITELEVLRAGRESIATGVWDFGHWQSCTCGHVYVAATEAKSPTPEDVTGLYVRFDGWEVYEAALRAVVRANPELAARAHTYRMNSMDVDPVVMLVSDMTKLAARGGGTGDTREAALALLDAAISLEEANQEAARLQVLASAQRDATDPHVGERALLASGQRWRSEERRTIRELTNAGR